MEVKVWQSNFAPSESQFQTTENMTFCELGTNHILRCFQSVFCGPYVYNEGRPDSKAVSSRVLQEESACHYGRLCAAHVMAPRQ